MDSTYLPRKVMQLEKLRQKPCRSPYKSPYCHLTPTQRSTVQSLQVVLKQINIVKRHKYSTVKVTCFAYCSNTAFLNEMQQCLLLLKFRLIPYPRSPLAITGLLAVKQKYNIVLNCILAAFDGTLAHCMAYSACSNHLGSFGYCKSICTKHCN